jgi:hypothetical protein
MLVLVEDSSASVELPADPFVDVCTGMSVAKSTLLLLLLSLANSNSDQGRVPELGENVGKAKSTAYFSERHEEGQVGRSSSRWRLGPTWCVNCESYEATVDPAVLGGPAVVTGRGPVADLQRLNEICGRV